MSAVGLFIGICLLAVGLGVAGVLIARRNHANAVDTADTVPVAEDDLGRDGLVQPGESKLLFTSTALGDTYGRLSAVPADVPDGPRQVADLQCERVDFRTGTGVCLQSDRGLLTTYEAIVFDNALDKQHTVGLAGAPSRVRVSPEGTIAGVTVFVTGHSYAIVGFSTQTLLIDLADGDVIADLEVDFTTRKDGDVFQAVDFNFWVSRSSTSSTSTRRSAPPVRRIW